MRLWGTVREAPGEKTEAFLPQVHFVDWIVLGHDVTPPVTDVYINL